MIYRNKECAACALKNTCPEAKAMPEEKKPAPAIRELTEVNEAVDEMIDSLFVVLDRINNAQVFLASMRNLVDGMLSLLEEEYDLPQLTEE